MNQMMSAIGDGASDEFDCGNPKGFQVDAFVRLNSFSEAGEDGEVNISLDCDGHEIETAKNDPEKNFMDSLSPCFDRVFDSELDTNSVYQSVSNGMMDRLLGGGKCAVLVCGRTGVTESMFGSNDRNSLGFAQLAVQNIFEKLECERFDKNSLKVRLGFFEICNNSIKDLLMIKDDADHESRTAESIVGFDRMTVSDEGYRVAGTADEAFEMLCEGLSTSLFVDTSARKYTGHPVLLRILVSAIYNDNDHKFCSQLDLIHLVLTEDLISFDLCDSRFAETHGMDGGLDPSKAIFASVDETHKAGDEEDNESNCLDILLKESLINVSMVSIVSCISQTSVSTEKTSSLDFASNIKAFLMKAKVKKGLIRRASKIVSEKFEDSKISSPGLSPGSRRNAVFESSNRDSIDHIEQNIDREGDLHNRNSESGGGIELTVAPAPTVVNWGVRNANRDLKFAAFDNMNNFAHLQSTSPNSEHANEQRYESMLSILKENTTMIDEAKKTVDTIDSQLNEEMKKHGKEMHKLSSKLEFELKLRENTGEEHRVLAQKMEQMCGMFEDNSSNMLKLKSEIGDILKENLHLRTKYVALSDKLVYLEDKVSFSQERAAALNATLSAKDELNKKAVQELEQKVEEIEAKSKKSLQEAHEKLEDSEDAQFALQNENDTLKTSLDASEDAQFALQESVDVLRLQIAELEEKLAEAESKVQKCDDGLLERANSPLTGSSLVTKINGSPNHAGSDSLGGKESVQNDASTWEAFRHLQKRLVKVDDSVSIDSGTSWILDPMDRTSSNHERNDESSTASVNISLKASVSHLESIDSISDQEGDPQYESDEAPKSQNHASLAAENKPEVTNLTLPGIGQDRLSNVLRPLLSLVSPKPQKPPNSGAKTPTLRPTGEPVGLANIAASSPAISKLSPFVVKPDGRFMSRNIN